MLLQTQTASTALFLIRHAQTDWNVEGRLQGLVDRPLSIMGRGQASQLGITLAGKHFDAVFCSDLLRARETAALAGMLSATPLPIWREINVGRWSGKLISDIQRLETEAYDSWSAGQADPPGGEGWAEFDARIRSALNDIAKLKCQRVAVVTHKIVINTVIRILGDTRRAYDYSYPNVSVTEVMLRC